MHRAARARLLLAALAPTAVDLRPRALARSCAAELDADGVTIALAGTGGPAVLLAGSGRLATEVEELQFLLGEGPCVDAVALGRPVLVPDLPRRSAGRWPAFVEGATGLGVAAVFAFPLRVGRAGLGVLGVYRGDAGDLTAGQLGTALAHGDAATALLLHLQARARTGDGALAAVEVLEDRAQVHQASGVVAVQAGVDVGEALLLLRSRAFADGVPLLVLARAVLAHEVRFDPDAPPPGLPAG